MAPKSAIADFGALDASESDMPISPALAASCEGRVAATQDDESEA